MNIFKLRLRNRFTKSFSYDDYITTWTNLQVFFWIFCEFLWKTYKMHKNLLISDIWQISAKHRFCGDFAPIYCIKTLNFEQSFLFRFHNSKTVHILLSNQNKKREYRPTIVFGTLLHNSKSLYIKIPYARSIVDNPPTDMLNTTARMVRIR